MIHLAAGDHQSIMFQLISFVLFLIIIIFHALLLTPTSARCYFGGETCLNNGFEIQYPFWSSQRSVTENSSEVYYPCGYSGFEINCGIETARKAVMNISDHLYYVLENIDYYSKWLRVMDKDVDRQNCPRPKRNISLESNPMLSYDKQYLFYNCSSYPIAKSRYDFLQVQDIPCLNNNSNLTDDKYSYAVYDYGYDDSVLSWFKENCQETVVIPVFTGNYSESARFGFNFSWSVPDECDKCERSGGNCYYNKTAEVYQCDCSTWRTDGPTSYDPLICRHDQHGVPAALGGLLLSLFLLYIRIFNLLYHFIFSRCRNKTKGTKNVEALLESYGCFALQRHKYSDIRAMTKSFKHTLGQGGYGCVFKGTLRNDGRLVAVKVLNESKGNGEEFINEVATIGGLPTGLKAIIGVSTGVVGLLLILLLIYRKTFYALGYSAISRWKKKIKKPTNVEEFLEGYGVALHRYNYSEIKKMTNSFKDTLGQGGYGSVFQGKLNRDGVLVAVKLLNESKGNGEDFINEVATIGRTNHVNVVSLLGFCTEGTKRALVYEFMPNGSLERFIYNDKMSSPNATTLGWDKLYQIALGIARGLEYLHCRCNTRIVHFDIKPHNILLDQDFCPKISDFGLAKLCPTKESIVSMVGTRGTMGYIAPEIACRNLGGVSHKSDVYSYGMMVLEMIGGRKNLDVTVENMSGIYFPHWIYNQLKQDSKVGGPEVMKFEGAGAILKDATAKKMIIVALWCIQTHPANRPSMTKVVEMLEGSDEVLQMPPNPSTDHVSLSSSSST